MIELDLASLFELEPSQWGLRGDPFLWQEMKSRMLFSKNIHTARDFDNLLNKLFLELTSSMPRNNDFIFVKRYNLGGMSSGHVSSEFWIKKVFPMLIERFEDLYGGLKEDN